LLVILVRAMWLGWRALRPVDLYRRFLSFGPCARFRRLPPLGDEGVVARGALLRGVWLLESWKQPEVRKRAYLVFVFYAH